MRDRIYIATFSDGAIETIRKYGLNIELNDLCISENLDPDKMQGTLSAMEKEIYDSQAKKTLIHGPFTEIIPASIDHRAVDMGLNRLEEAYQAARQIKVNKMIVHSGYMPLLYYKEWNHKKSLYFWERFMANKPENFHIYIENVFEDEPQMMKALIKDLADPRIGVCLDVGHANAVTCQDYEVLDWIKILGPNIRHFHLHNNNGKEDQHGPLTEGTLDMKAVLEAIKDFCPQESTLTIESRTCNESAKWLIDQLET